MQQKRLKSRVTPPFPIIVPWNEFISGTSLIYVLHKTHLLENRGLFSLPSFPSNKAALTLEVGIHNKPKNYLNALRKQEI